jgi:hypothetical protein
MKLIKLRGRRIEPDSELAHAVSQPGRCQATTKAGTRCRLPEWEHTGRCLIHLPARPPVRPA